VAKSRAEAEIWMDQTVASGMTVWYHWVGGQKGLGEDRRWQEIGKRYMDWLSRHDLHFDGDRSVANVGVVMGQSTHLFYTPPGEGGMPQFMTASTTRSWRAGSSSTSSTRTTWGRRRSAATGRSCCPTSRG
jgi:hypothetical protein